MRGCYLRRNSWLKTIYIAKFKEKIVDEYGNYIDTYEEPKKYEMNVQPLNGGIEIETYGSRAMQIQKAICRSEEYAGKFHENDVAYLENQTPDGESVHGDNANYRIDSVLTQNKCIAIYFEKRAGR